MSGRIDDATAMGASIWAELEQTMACLRRPHSSEHSLLRQHGDTPLSYLLQAQFRPDGQRGRAIALAIARSAKCVFADEGPHRMSVASAAPGRSDEPPVGALSEVDLGMAGIAPLRDAG